MKPSPRTTFEMIQAQVILRTLKVLFNVPAGPAQLQAKRFGWGAVKIGQATVSPYKVVWTPGATGSYVLTAVATDNAGLTATSNAATVSVTAVTGTTVFLQRGLNGYAGVSDTFLDKYVQTTVRGAMTSLYLDSANFVTGEILHVDGGQSAGH